MLAFGKFTTELPGGVERRVDLAPELALRIGNCRDNVREREVVTNNQDIDITHGRLSSRRHRTEDEGHADAVCYGCQGLFECLGHPESFADDAVKFSEYRTMAIRLEVNLTALDTSGENSGPRKAFQISLNGA